MQIRDLKVCTFATLSSDRSPIERPTDSGKRGDLRRARTDDHRCTYFTIRILLRVRRCHRHGYDAYHDITVVTLSEPALVRIWDTVGEDQSLKGEYKVLSGAMCVSIGSGPVLISNTDWRVGTGAGEERTSSGTARASG